MKNVIRLPAACSLKTEITSSRTREVRSHCVFKLPFGEELYVGVSSRTTQQGYTGDSVRQKFTSKERDIETGLDYFGARYYASTQGRFTGVDPIAIKLKHLVNPQDLNRYAYVANNPLRFIDPDGQEKIEIIVRTFIPAKRVQVPGTPFTAKGDNRKAGEQGTSRTEIRVVIETDPRKGHASVDESHKAGPSEMFIGAGPLERSVEKGQAKGDSLGSEVSRRTAGAGDPIVDVRVFGNEKFPLTPAPGIKFDFTISVNPNANALTDNQMTATIKGGVAVFPETEILVKREGSTQEQLIYDHPPSGLTRTPADLAIQNPDPVAVVVKLHKKD